MQNSIPKGRSLVVLFLLVIAWAGVPARTGASGQAPPASAFTVNDMLDVATLRVADLSADGRWLAATASTLRDRIGIDNSRYGDPTYIAPSLNNTLIIDTQTGKRQNLFPQKRQIRGLKWSRDGSRLAFTVLKGDRYEPMIWERPTGKFFAVPVPDGKILADNTELSWSPTGKQLFFSLRAEEWRKKAAERFIQETRGPVVVHSSKEPFLAWDDVRRLSQLRSIAAHDLAGQTREILPETRLNSTTLAQDGTFLTYYEDITAKTDYDVISGTESRVKLLPLGAGPARTVIQSTKDLRVTWARSGRHYGYAKKGDIFFASVDDKEPRQLTGKEDSAVKQPPPSEPPTADPDKTKEKESFGLVQVSPQGERLVISSKKGLYLLLISVDNFKQVNTTQGQQTGNRLLLQFAKILKDTFRNTDIIARVGEDTFAVLTIEAEAGSSEIMAHRLLHKLEAYNARANADSGKLLASMGTAYHQPKYPGSLEALLQQADLQICDYKRGKQKSALLWYLGQDKEN